MFKILLIDDDEVDRQVIKRALGKTNLEAEIQEVDNPEKGLELFTKKQFDCILLDYRMPGKNGLEVLQQLFETDWEGPPSVIMLTGMNDDELAMQCLRAGAQDFLVKENLTPASLMRAITNAIERKNLNDQRLGMEEKIWENKKNEAVAKATNMVATEFETLWASLNLALKPLGYENLSKTGAKSLNEAVELVKRGIELGGGLLDLSSDEKTTDRLEEVNFLINDAKLILQGVLGDFKSLEFKPVPRRRSVQINKGLFKNALMNLVQNSAEAMQPGGVCTISIKEVMVDEKTKTPVEGMTGGEYIQFSVSDTGSGMSKEVLKQAALPHFTTKKGRNALGIGLSQVADFVKKSDGYMKIESKPGEGTTVRLYFFLLKRD